MTGHFILLPITVHGTEYWVTVAHDTVSFLCTYFSIDGCSLYIRFGLRQISKMTWLMQATSTHQILPLDISQRFTIITISWHIWPQFQFDQHTQLYESQVHAVKRSKRSESMQLKRSKRSESMPLSRLKRSESMPLKRLKRSESIQLSSIIIFIVVFARELR